MRIRGSSSAFSPSSSSSDSADSTVSSIIASSSSSTSGIHHVTSSLKSNLRCQGLDLLVKAVYHVVAGSAIAVPYIQRRVVRKRKRATRFQVFRVEDDEEEEGEGDLGRRKRKRRRGKRTMAMPSRFRDYSVNCVE